MNNARRNLIKALPLAALAGVTLKVADTEVQAVEIRPDKRYVFKVNRDVPQEELNSARQRITERGFQDCLIVSGDVDIYELDEPK